MVFLLLTAVGACAQPTSCIPQSQAALLSAFSDAAGPQSVTPRNIRNFICSTQTTIGASFIGATFNGGTFSGSFSGTPTATGVWTFPAGITVPDTGAIAPQSAANLTISAGGSGSLIEVKAGPGGGGPPLLLMGGSPLFIYPQVPIVLPGGTWGTGSLASNTAPLSQSATFSGTTTSLALGASLLQNDNSSNINGMFGINETLLLTGSGAVGARTAGAFSVKVLAVTGNTAGGVGFVGEAGLCELAVTDGGGGNTCFGSNPQAVLDAGVTGSINGMTVNLAEGVGSTPLARIGIIFGDTVANGAVGVQATGPDDIIFAMNTQYVPSSTEGFRVGIGFGLYSGFFPVATTGTLINGEGVHGSGFTVANGIDWHLGAFTGNSWNDGHTILTGAGEIIAAKITDPNSAPGAGNVKVTAEAGTNSGTCKIVVRAGTSATPTTLLDNIGGGC
jgi:hypothetical protein